VRSHIAEYGPAPLEFVDGEGCTLIEKRGRRYLDFLGGWCVATVGWKRREMIEAITAQAAKGFYAPPQFRSAPQEALATLLCDHAPGKLARAFRCTSGSEAVDLAIKCARASTGKKGIVSIDGVFHGHTYGALCVGNEFDERVGPGLPGFFKLPMPRSRDEGEAVADAFESLLEERGDVAAFFSEPVWTNAGCVVPPDAFYPRVQELCRKHGALLAMDEVATCFRCGPLFASELWGLEPDILCLGKAFTGGYAAVGATLVTEEVFERSRGIPDYSSFGWMPQDVAAALRNVELVLGDALHENARAVGRLLLEELKPLESLALVKEVRGIGMVLAVEFTEPLAKSLALFCYREGLLVGVANESTLLLSPPLVLDRAEAARGAQQLRAVVTARAV
jgi:acetylornithine/succinyldiaminopimelate/putrescine aminotransferase